MPEPVPAQGERVVHPLLGWISGMCTDERPHTEIDAKVLEAKALAHELEAERDDLREECDLAAEQGRLVGQMADRYADLLRRILASLEDGSLDVPEVCHAVEAEIKEALSS